LARFMARFIRDQFSEMSRSHATLGKTQHESIYIVQNLVEEREELGSLRGSEIMQLLRQCDCLLEKQSDTFRGAIFPSQEGLFKEGCQCVGQALLRRIEQETDIINRTCNFSC